MERSSRSTEQMLRENIARFLENADGREVIINVTAQLVKKHQTGDTMEKRPEKKEVTKEIKTARQPRRHYAETVDILPADIFPSTANKSPSIHSQNSSSLIDWYGKGVDRYHYGKE